MIRAIVAWYRGGRSTPQEFYFAGFAGVGKSTTAAAAIDELRDLGLIRRVRTAAFTGQAAAVLRRKGVGGAMTIHALCYGAPEDDQAAGDGAEGPAIDPVSGLPVSPFQTGELKFRRQHDAPASEADLIVIDEGSMVPDELADDIRWFGKKILVMGDPGQLPPVRGQGAFVGRKPDAFLTEIHRQAADSPIIQIGALARRGLKIRFGDWGDGVRVLPLNRETQGLIYRPETVPICGLHRVRWVYSQRIRRSRGFEGPTPQSGEPLVCRKNDRALGLYNGQPGLLLDEPWDDQTGHLHIQVAMETGYAPQPLGLEVDPFLFQQHFVGPTPQPKMRHGVYWYDWGYMRTCHGVQGSEFDDVTVVDDSPLLRGVIDPAKWLYTAASRASKRLTLLLRT